MTAWVINDNTLDIITRSASEKYNNTQVVIKGQVINCELSPSKSVLFQPIFTKIENQYEIEMKFISTYDNLPVQIHVDVNYDYAESNYYASLHPQMMDVKWDNTLHVPLPFQKLMDMESVTYVESQKQQYEVMSISMCLMIHNASEFGIHYNDLSTNNMNIMANMTAPNQSYALPDIISIFYGISNSIISILDSISDIMFIVFLWHFSEIQNYDDDEFRQSEKVSNFLITLLIGNLISVAIAISVYTTRQIETKSFAQQTLLHIVFFMLSPCLPAFEWILKKMQSYNPDILMIYPGCDGLLVWFEQELVRNKIFVMESVMESCFQIIVQFVAVFVLQTIEYKDAYLYFSITISFIVIISKFILVSYNAQLSMIYFNLFCYSMDIFFSLLFSLFIG
eukprot:113041_1